MIIFMYMYSIYYVEIPLPNEQARLDIIKIHAYKLNSDILYEYACCLGIEFVTIDTCQQLNNHNHNYLY